MNFRQLEYLQLIVETGSFSAAAKAAGVTQPAVSQAIAALELEWETTLFEKNGRQKLPTRATLVAVRKMGELQARIGRFQQLLAEPEHWGDDGRTPLLRVGMAPAAALLYGPCIAHICETMHPGSLLQITSGTAPELLSSLRSKELDMALVPCPRRWHAQGIHRSVLHVSEPAVYGRTGHPLLNAQSLVEIRSAQWAVAGRAGTAGNVIEEAHRVRHLPPPQIAVQFDGYASMVNLVAHSDLLCVIPHPILLSDSQRLQLSELHLREGLPQYEVSLFWPSVAQQRTPALIRALVQALKAMAAGS